MYSVEFYSNDDYVGKITLNTPGGFVVEPTDSESMRKVLAEPIRVADKQAKRVDKVYSYDDPVRFITSLSMHYRSQGLRATNAAKAEKKGGVDIPFADRPPQQRAPPRPSTEEAPHDTTPREDTSDPTPPAQVSGNPSSPSRDEPPAPTTPRVPPPPAPHTGGGPIDQRRYGEQPGPGWRRIGTSARGTPIWDWGPPPTPTSAQDEANATPRPADADEPTTTAGRRGNIGPGSQPNVNWTDQPSERMATAPPRPTDAVTNPVGQGANQPVGTETAGVGPAPATGQPSNQSTVDAAAAGTDPADVERLDKTLFRFQKFSNFLRKRGQHWAAQWVDELQQYVDDAGVDAALAALPPQPIGGDPSTVSYQGTGYFEPGDRELYYIKSYLSNNGIIFQTDEAPIPGVRRIRSAPLPEDSPETPREQDYTPAWTSLRDKLEESKLLPGLESSEDLDIVAGAIQQVPEDSSTPVVTKITPDVIAKLDEKYGKDGWIIKTYGDEAYAGFGIFLPPYVHQLSNTAKASIGSTQRKLMALGHTLVRNKQTMSVDGVIVSTPDGKKTHYKFNTPQFNMITDPEVKKLAAIAQYHAPNENGATIPTSAENNLKLKYGLTVNWGDEVKEDGTRDVVSVRHWNGRVIPFGSQDFEDLQKSVGDTLDRALASGGVQGRVRYMAQPAYEAFGVSNEDRAKGMTWETAQEGRVHITTKDGKVSVVPFASMAHRGEGMPVVFADEHIRAMEKAALEAIQAMPESERMGQTYAPDVMRTKDGWLVVERNASVPTGTSAWLEKNQLAIDAYVSHIMGREPLHARFIRKLLSERPKRQIQTPPNQPTGG